MIASRVAAVLGRLSRTVGAMTLASPPSCRVLVFDREGADVVGRMVLSDIPHAVFESRGERFYVAPRVLVRMARHFSAVRAAARPGELPDGLRGLAQAIWRSYLLACFDLMRPGVVVTYIDNSAAFQWVSRRVRGPVFLAVQNGSRLRPNVHDWLPRPPRAGSVISMPHLYCFSRYEPELYARFGHEVDEYHVVGSIRGDYYRDVVAPQRRDRPSYDLCIVSEWEASLFEPDTPFPAVGAALRRLYAHLTRFLSEHDHAVVVALRSPDPREARFFADAFGARAVLVASDRGSMSTYAAMDDSRVIVTLNSTAGREAFGWGHAVLFCNLTGDDGYRPPRADALWLLEEPDYGAFAAALSRLLGMPREEFVARARAALPYIMHHDPMHPAHETIRGDIRRALAGVAA